MGVVLSQNYRCVVILGKARSLTDPAEKAAALLKITEHIIPGRTQHARAASDRELAQTAVLAIDLEEVSAKVRRAGPPCMHPWHARCGQPRVPVHARDARLGAARGEVVLRVMSPMPA